MWHIVLILIVLIVVFRPKYKSPEVIRGVITDEECDYIKSTAKEKLKPSTIGDEFVEDEEIRKSETAWLDPTTIGFNRLLRNVWMMSLCARTYRWFGTHPVGFSNYIKMHTSNILIVENIHSYSP